MRICENPECGKELRGKQKFFCSKKCNGKIRARGNKSALGHKKSEECKKIISEQKKGNTYRRGARLPEEQKRKHSEYMKGRNEGANNIFWQGGSQIKYAPGLTFELKISVRERDRHQCQACNVTEQRLGKALDVHHIDHAGNNHSLSNLVSLCRSCHNKIRTQGIRGNLHIKTKGETICAL